jgi:sigma-E factor negative regulatory protein RseC
MYLCTGVFASAVAKKAGFIKIKFKFNTVIFAAKSHRAVYNDGMSSQCHELGTIETILPDGRARVRVTRAEACGHCAARGACGVFGTSGSDIRLTLDNPMGAVPGDQVTLTLPASVLFRISAVVYLVPGVFLLLGALVGRSVARPGATPEPMAIVGALTGLSMGLLCTWILGRRMRTSPALIPRITAVTGNRHTDEQVTS